MPQGQGAPQTGKRGGSRKWSRSRLPFLWLTGLAIAVLGVLGVLGVRATGLVSGTEEVSSAAEAPPSSAMDPGSAAASDGGTSAAPGGGSGRRQDDEQRGPAGARAPQAEATTTAGARELAEQVQEVMDEGRGTGPAEFVVGSLNVLGASHTTAGGNKPRYAPGHARMQRITGLLQNHEVDVVGLQEFEPVQLQALRRASDDGYGVYPGLALGRGPMRNSVAWRRDAWELLEGRTTPIPYFGGKRVQMPYVLLQHRETEQLIFVVNIHNPASNRRRGNNQRWRDLGTTLETRLANRLHGRTDVPVILVGDFNERQEAFCRVTGAGLRAANGGQPPPDCAPPADAGIDWIFATPDVTFVDYIRLESVRSQGLSDHPLILARARTGP